MLFYAKNHSVRARYPHSPVFIELFPRAPKRYLIIRGLYHGIHSIFIHNASYSVSYIRRAGDGSLLHLITQCRNMEAQRRLSLHEHRRTYTFEGITHTSTYILNCMKINNSTLICKAHITGHMEGSTLRKENIP